MPRDAFSRCNSLGCRHLLFNVWDKIGDHRENGFKRKSFGEIKTNFLSIRRQTFLGDGIFVTLKEKFWGAKVILLKIKEM